MIQEIASKLQSVRKSLGFTQEYVANKLDLRRGKIIEIEKGEAKIDIGTLEKFSKLYGYSLDYFLSTKKNEEISFAFRANGVNENELEIKAWGMLILNNIRNLNDIVEEENL